MFIGILPLVYFVETQYGFADPLNAVGDTLFGSDAVGAEVSDASTDPLDPLDRGVRNLSFGVGEELSFDINYGFINAGSAQMRVVDVVEWEGRPCYFIQTLAHSNSFFNSPESCICSTISQPPTNFPSTYN